MTSRLEIKNVTLKYSGSKTPALKNISCQLTPAKKTILLGANGSGKSTLAKVICGLLPPDSGEVLLDGKPLAEGWNGIGYLFQNPDEQLLASTVETELAWGLENLRLPHREMSVRVEECLEMFGLQDIRRHPPEHLSDGQKQLVAIAAIVAMRPSYLILDECTAFLDPGWKARIACKVDELAADMGVLWISSRPAEATRADEVWLMRTGEIIEQGSPDVLRRTDKLAIAGLANVD